jgi:hypothetical protein
VDGTRPALRVKVFYISPSALATDGHHLAYLSGGSHGNLDVTEFDDKWQPVSRWRRLHCPSHVNGRWDAMRVVIYGRACARNATCGAPGSARTAPNAPKRGGWGAQRPCHPPRIDWHSLAIEQHRCLHPEGVLRPVLVNTFRHSAPVRQTARDSSSPRRGPARLEVWLPQPTAPMPTS